MLSYERRYDPKAWLAGFKRGWNVGACVRLAKLVLRVAAWHFKRCVAAGSPLRAFIAFMSLHGFHIRRSSTLWCGPVLHQVEEVDLAECLHYLPHLRVHEGQRQPSQIQFILYPSTLILILQISLTKEQLGLHHLEGGRAFDVVELRVRPKEIFDPPRSHAKDRKCLRTVKLNILNRRQCSSGLEAAMRVLKYRKISSAVILNGKLEQIIFKEWFSASKYLVFY